ncbi:hypothetical protein ILUMI_04791 [Ignelater luminosus]|uniref:E3 ubiquitin-protein ligase n=1 Tax=Ignelater luminosus TaxID=2038154 RepID=A0A8K0GKS6_IGNLU|nr:hypothetical protein ILUMI_04791 [Ignelater luminosus]
MMMDEINNFADNENTGERNPLTLNEVTTMTGLDLNFCFLGSPELLCKKCKNYLYPPVMLLEDVGNVCGFCSVIDGVDVANHGVRNMGLETVLRQLAIPCRYYSRGCGELLDFEVLEHLEVCVYRDFQCPLRVIGTCGWEGDLGNLVDHGLIYHFDSTIRGFRNYFLLNVDTIPGSDVVMILYTDVDKFILRVKCDEEKLQFLMYFIGNKAKVSNLSYAIEQRDLGTIGNEYGTAMLHEGQLKSDFDENQALTVCLAVVKEYILESTLTLSIKILKKTQSSHQLDEKLLSYFECPICTSYMKPPIYQCSAGHSICNQCRPKLRHCHICRGHLGHMRNYTFEQIGNKMEFPCLYRDGGCSTILPAKDIVKHEAECPLQPYRCLFDICHWQGVYSAFIKHLQICHKHAITFSNYKADFGRLNINTEYCMIAHGQIFRVISLFDRPSNSIHWTVQLIGPDGRAKMYKYEIGLIGSRHRKYARTDICQNYTNNTEDIIGHCTTIPYSAVLHYATDGEVLSYCRVVKLIFKSQLE